jgi:pimeloyl-ACP methyl ester carboxylesterase
MQPERPSDPPQHVVAVDGSRLAYSLEGSAGPVVVAVPGLPGSGRDFRWLAPALTGWARVLRFDPPGYGASPRPDFAPVGADRKADLVLGLLDALGLDRAMLLGHSFGSVVAVLAAARRPDAVTHLALLAPPGITAHFPVRLARLAAEPLRHERGRRLLAGPQRLGYRWAGFPSFLSDDELAVTSLDSGAADFAGYRAALDAASTIPTMLAWAADDRQVPPRNSAALHAHAGPGPRVAFATGGHNIQKTRAVELGAMLRRFAAPASTRSS